MKKKRAKKNNRSFKNVSNKENEILKKYAAPRDKTFLHFEKLQEDFYLMVNKNEHPKRNAN